MLAVLISRYLKARQGNFSIMFALMVMGILGLCGIAYDVTNIMRVKSQLNASADTAALSAVKAKIQNDSTAEAQGKKYFESNATAMGNVKVDSVNIDFKKNPGSNDVTAKVRYVATVKPSFMGVFGYKSVKVSEAVTATAGSLQKVHISFLIDNSASMGVGATLEDQKIMFDMKGCALACHRKSSWESTSSLEQVRKAGAKVRIDITRGAVQNMLKDLQASKVGADNLKVEVFSFSNEIAHVYGPGDNLAQARQAVGGIDLTRESYTGGTNIAHTMKAFTKIQKANIEKNPEYKYITVLVTDGVVNSRWEYASSSGKNTVGQDKNAVISSDAVYLNAHTYVQAPETGFCNGLKSMKNIIFVINTDYIAKTKYTNTTRSFSKVASILPDVNNVLRECAGSDTRYINASSPAEIYNAAQKVLGEIDNEISPRLSH